jgi:hypothetical protein
MSDKHSKTPTEWKSAGSTRTRARALQDVPGSGSNGSSSAPHHRGHDRNSYAPSRAAATPVTTGQDIRSTGASARVSQDVQGSSSSGSGSVQHHRGWGQSRPQQAPVASAAAAPGEVQRHRGRNHRASSGSAAGSSSDSGRAVVFGVERPTGLVDDVLTQVFKFLGNQCTIIAIATLVCRQFRRVATHDAGLFQHLCENALCRVGRLEKAFDQGVHVAKVRWSRSMNGSGGRQYSQKIARNTTLHSIHIKECSWNGLDMQFLSRALFHNTSVRTLDLGDNAICHFDLRGATHLEELLVRNTTIRTLNLCSNYVGDESVQLIANGLTNNTTLESLNLYFNRIGVDGVRHLMTALERNSTLHSLNLGWNQEMGSVGLNLVLNALKDNSSIHTLSLQGNAFGDENVPVLCEMLQVNTTLRSLDLKHCGIRTVSAISSLTESLGSNTTLRKLNIQDINEGDYDACANFSKFGKSRDLTIEADFSR